jgi:hypothetical protein
MSHSGIGVRLTNNTFDQGGIMCVLERCSELRKGKDWNLYFDGFEK